MSRIAVHPCREAGHFACCALLLLTAQVVTALDLPPRWRWSNPTPHGANVYDMASDFGLTIQVGERGQIYTSEDLLLWTPRQSNTSRSLRAVTFFNERIIITGQAGTVLFADTLDDFQIIDLGTEDWLEGVAASPERAVAVGDNGAVYASTNGIDWARQSTPINEWLRAVAYCRDKFVIVGEFGRIATSPDGLSWTLRNSGITTHLNRIAWEGNRVWIVGDNGTILRSQTGGTSWAPVITGATNDLFGVNAHSEGGLAAGDREVRRRLPDGSWVDDIQSLNDEPAPSWTYFSALWLDTVHFIAGRSGFMVEGFRENAESPFVWVSRQQPIRNWLWDLLRAPGVYVTVGFRGTIMTSVDGVDWNLEAVPQSATNSVLLGIGGTTNLLLAVGNNGTILTSPRLPPPDESPPPSTGSFLGIIWNEQSPVTTADLQGVTTHEGAFIVTGASGTVLISSDGSNWTTRLTPTSAYLSGVASSTNGIVAVGQHGTILTSPDGLAWTPQFSGTTNWIYRVRNLEDQLVAVGQNGTLLVSEDGTNWVQQDSGTTRWLNDVTLMEGTYLAIGTQGTVLASSNLLDWVSIGTITGKSLYGVAHAEGQLVVAGVEGAIIRSQVTPILSPVEIVRYSRVDQENIYLFSGKPDQIFSLDQTTTFTNWPERHRLEILESSGTLLLLESGDTNSPSIQYYRTRLTP